MRQLRPTRLTLVGLAALAVLGCGKTQGDAATGKGAQGASAGAGSAASRGLPVKAGVVQVQDVVYRIQALGTLEAEETIQVTAEVDGAVAEVHFREGDRVGRESVLLLIDPERYRLEAERAEANYRSALAEQQRADEDLKRREELARQNLLSVEELNRARVDFQKLAADASSSKAARDIAVQNVARSRVRPVHAGVIDKRMVDTGQFVKAGTVLASLVDTTRLRLRFKISEGESMQAHVGQPVTFRVLSLGELEFKGEIYHVGEVADPTTRQVEVLGWVKNTGRLKPGFFAEIALPSESKKAALVVPESAVQASERGFIAFVIEDGKARVRSIKIGLRTGGGGVEILSGLKAGETIVYEGSDRLADGLLVRSEAPQKADAQKDGAEKGATR